MNTPLQQVHSSSVQIIDKPGTYADTDALITISKNIYLIISVADCFPILVYDKVNMVVAAIHSGWRGTQKQILSHTLTKMISELNCKPENLYVFTGPGICEKHFEIGKEVVKLFDSKYLNINNGKYFIDLKANLSDQLSLLKIPGENIEFSSLCTFHEKDYLHSYRRDREKSGRMMAVIGMK